MSSSINKVLVLLILLLIFLIPVYFELLPANTTFLGYRFNSKYSECLKPDLLQFDYRRRLSDKIAKVLLDINRVTGSKKGIVDAKWALQLSEVVAELDPQRRTSSYDWDFSARLPNMWAARRTKPDGQPRNVCPEVYKFDKKDTPYFQNAMYQETCTYVPKFYDTLTILIPSQSWKPEDLNFVANRISKYYDIRIIGLVKHSTTFINSMPKKLTYLEVKNAESDSEAISRAMKLIKTPFVLIGNNLSQFNNQSSLERLVRVLDELPPVKVAAGAARDSQGRWIHGCLQQKMENYHATYDLGYYSSKYECMYCDDHLTPFVTHTKLFEQVTLKKGLNGPIVFHDWFVRVRHAGHLTVTCPDVMFYVNKHPMMAASDWKTFAQQWSLTSIKSYDDTIFNFSCEEAKISCKGLNELIRFLLIPPCCSDAILGEIGYILNYAEQNNLTYELHCGSGLGAVKLGTHLPWDLDMDLIFDCEDWSKWLEMQEGYLNKRNCTLKIAAIRKTWKFFKIQCPTLRYEFICITSKPKLSRDLMPEEFVNIPTKINFGGRWTSVISNPGLTARNHYGMEDLRHANHWSKLKNKNKDAAMAGHYDNPGSWNRCSSPNHHACLDHFPGDGSIPFLKR